jgi:hypothetical protein
MVDRRPSTASHLALLAACVLTTMLAGCGGGGRPGGTSAGGEAFVAEATEICASTQRAGRSLKTPRGPAELVPYFDAALSLGRGEVAKLRALHPPSDKTAAYSTYLSGLDQEIVVLERADAAAKAGNVAQVSAIVQEANALTQKSTENAKALGLVACTKGE